MNSLNETLVSIGVSHVKKKRLSAGQNSKKKFEKIVEVLKNYYGVPELENAVTVNDELVMISQLKEKFKEINSSSVMVQILTVLGT